MPQSLHPAIPGQNGGTIISIEQPLSSYHLPDSLSFCGEPVPLNQPHIRERAERELYLMLQDQGQLILNIKRSGIFFPMFEKIAREDSVPDDLKYIAVIESALLNSRSAKDAFGIWQFIESTGRKMGLEIDKDVDERLNIVKATHAAYQYLKEGHSIFHSWTMAAAGYNMGHEFLAEQVLYQRDSNFYNLYLNEETSRYVFRIVVMKEIMQHPEWYGIHLLPADLYKPDPVRTTEVSDAIPDIEDWAVANGTTYKWVKVFNPWILNHSLPKPKQNAYEIVTPVFDPQ
ncbi:MAG TPA: lytic transglycosylase domain-containing protein [Candidatus Kapabacteria bacterium]|nr:lytic transglycosylase domain-containing protein [Candidatus Kapabacteria bacterium]